MKTFVFICKMCPVTTQSEDEPCVLKATHDWDHCELPTRCPFDGPAVPFWERQKGGS